MKKAIFYASIFFGAIIIVIFNPNPAPSQSKVLKATTVKSSPVRANQKPDQWIKMKEGFVVSPQKYGEFKINGSGNKPRNLNPECGDHPTCDPTAADNCCAFMEKCNKNIHCGSVDWSKFQEIYPDIQPAPYCKICRQGYTGDDADLPLDISTCWCSTKPSPTGPFEYANHDLITLWLGEVSASDTGDQLKAPDFYIEYTDKTGNKRVIGANGAWVSFRKKEERFWVGCNKNELYFAPKPGDSLERFQYEGGGNTFFEVAPETRVTLRSLNIKCEYKDHNYQGPNHLVVTIPSTGFEFKRDSNSIRVVIKKH